jgi:hypothetical protein
MDRIVVAYVTPHAHKLYMVGIMTFSRMTGTRPAPEMRDGESLFPATRQPVAFPRRASVCVPSLTLGLALAAAFALIDGSPGYQGTESQPHFSPAVAREIEGHPQTPLLDPNSLRGKN